MARTYEKWGNGAIRAQTVLGQREILKQLLLLLANDTKPKISMWQIFFKKFQNMSRFFLNRLNRNK